MTFHAVLGTCQYCRYNPSMRATQALRILADLSAPQWGMATTAQASAHGVTRHELSRLAQRGHLDRVAQGIYRDAGAPADAFEGIRAAWLGAEPARTAEERLSDLPNGVVVMGASAAALYGAGDLPADRHELSTPIRRQTQRSEVSYRHRQLDPADVTIALGLPVTTIERTIADLVEDRTDLSLVAQVLRDTARARRLDTARLSELLAPLAARNHLAKGDGAALLGRLNALAGLDATALVRQMSASETTGALVAASSLAHLNHADLAQSLIGPATQEALRALNESVARSVQQSIAPLLESFAASIEIPRLPGIDAALAAIAEQIAMTLPTRDLLASFGDEWSASIGKTLAAAGSDLAPAINAIEAARHAQAASVGG